jgi:energy-coupling factor transport system substrate-specific component
MFGCAWVGMFAGLLPPIRGKAEIAMLAGYGALSGYLFGFLLNLSFWPFSLDPASSIAYKPGLSFVAQWHRYLLFDASTSLGWDTGRAITNVLAILLVGPAALAVFRRAARRANFAPAVAFAPTSTVTPTAHPATAAAAPDTSRARSGGESPAVCGRDDRQADRV